MLWLHVLVTLLREVLRALSTPVRLLLYLPRRHHWRRVADEVLAEPPREQRDDERRILERLRSRGSPNGRRLFVSAGETSGEAHAARLVRALQGHDIEVCAFGGPMLADAGAEVRFSLSEHAVMGLRSVLRQLPLIVRAYATFVRMLRDEDIDLVVLVDYPGLHMVMAKACRRHGVPVLHYVAPQYWAWGPWRMRRYRRSVDATLTILPFEAAFFARFSVPARYIGHPLLDELDTNPPSAEAVAEAGSSPTLVLLPGSRRGEIEANLPGMLQTAARLQADHPGRARVVVVHKDPRRTELIETLLQQHAPTADVHLHVGPISAWLRGARVVLAKSGTGSLEACLHGNPVVVVYQLRGLLGTLGYHNILSVPYIAAANLVAGRRIVPEFCFHGQDGWQRVGEAVEQLWREGTARDEAVRGLAEMRNRLGAPGATERARRIVSAFFDEPSGASTTRQQASTPAPTQP
jgi:lipid-A-disaccharide synthase